MSHVCSHSNIYNRHNNVRSRLKDVLTDLNICVLTSVLWNTDAGCSDQWKCSIAKCTSSFGPSVHAVYAWVLNSPVFGLPSLYSAPAAKMRPASIRVVVGNEWHFCSYPYYYLGELGATDDDHLAHWKAHRGLPISVNWTFLLGNMAEALRAIIGSKSAISLQRGPVDKNLG